jgi:hypothetical protein
MSREIGENARQWVGFPTTHWSVVQQAGNGSGEIKRSALNALIRRYMPPLRAHLIHVLRLTPDRVDDVLQCFLTEKVLDEEVIQHAEQARGRFRNFLLVTLRRFVFNQIRHDSARSRSPSKQVSLDEATFVAGDTIDPTHTFEIAWAREVLAQAVEQVRRNCTATARPDLWGVFEGRVLGPALQNTEPVPYQELVDRYGFISPAQASNALVTANRMFVRALRNVIGEYVQGEAEIEEEISDLRRIVMSAGAGEA